MLAILLFGLAFGPQFWVRSVLRRHGGDRPDLPGTGGELAAHLLEEMGLDGVKVERTDLGDHYDPSERAVRLTPPVFDGRSVMAVSVAAHEVGHAMQDAGDYAPLKSRTRLAGIAMRVQRVGGVLMLAAPLLGILHRTPGLLVAEIAVGLMVLGAGVVIHLVTLPVELDASFARALPVLERGNYLGKDDIPAARRILQAAAMTYVAAALSSLLNVFYWLRVLR